MTHKLTIISTLLLTGVIIAGLAGGILVGLPRVDEYLKLKAFDDCAKAATYTYETSSVSTKEGEIMSSSVEPIGKFYKTCLEDKGYATKIEVK